MQTDRHNEELGEMEALSNRDGVRMYIQEFVRFVENEGYGLELEAEQDEDNAND